MPDRLDRQQKAIALGLARWLGPWADGNAYPRDVTRDEILLPRTLAEKNGQNAMRTWVYQPRARAPIGAVLLIHGLHYAGPADPRLDRFASVLASAGMLVYAPFFQAFERLMLDPSLFADAQSALQALLAHPFCAKHKPGVMSISFGSLPALSLAANPEFAEKIATVVLFGGYYSLADTVRFAVGGAPGRAHDPLNQPAVFLNYLEFIEELPASQRSAMIQAWTSFVHRTWGRPELKHSTESHRIAEDIARGLDPSVRPLFFQTTGCAPGAMAILERAIARAASEKSWIDPGAYLPAVSVPTQIIHGADDDVIAFEQAIELSRRIPSEFVAGLHITGLYGHSGKSQFSLSQITMLPKELAALTGALKAIALAGGRSLRTK